MSVNNHGLFEDNSVCIHVTEISSFQYSNVPDSVKYMLVF